MWGTVMKKNSSPWWMRIRVHLLLFGVSMSILPLFILGFLSFNTVSQYLQNSILQENYERVEILSNNIENFFKNLDKNLNYIASAGGHSLISKDKTTRKKILANLLKEPYIDEIMLANKDLMVIDKLSSDEDSKFSDADFMLAQREDLVQSEQSVSMSQVFFSKNREPELYLITFMEDPLTKNTLGYLQVKVKLKEIINDFVENHFEQGQIVYIVDASGDLIGHTDFNRVINQEDFRENPAVESFLEGNQQSSGSRYKNLDGVNVIGWFTSISYPNWGIFIEQPAKDVFKPIYNFAFTLLALGLLIMTIATIISVSFGVKLVQPIEKLEGRVRQMISEGELDSRIPVESLDEIGRLVQSFNQLLSILKDEKELLRTVVDGIGAGMVLLDEKLKIIWWNSIFANWFGSELENLPQEFSLENGRIISVSVKGETRHIRQMYYELAPGQSRNAVYLLLLEDVTRQVELETRMIETDKMAAVGLLASGVAHEINNPLAIAAAHSEDLLERLKDKEQGVDKDDVAGVQKIVLEQIARCKQIIAHLLGLARKGTDSDLVDIGLSSARILALLEPKAKQRDIKIESQIDSSLFVIGNESEWQQVVLNVVTNALDASNQGGVIEVKAWRDDIGIHFTVKDYGQGIPKEYIKKLFVPFFTTKPVGQGTGLGLFVSYNIIQKMQGQLVINSTEGKGTLVKITFLKGGA